MQQRTILQILFVGLAFQAALGSDKHVPQQIFLSFASGYDMVVSWATPETCASVVQYGTVSGTYTFTATGVATSYTFNGIAASTFHHTTLTGLKPGTKYYYVVGDPEYHFSTEYSFTTAPEPGTLPYVLAVLGDPGQTSHSNETVNLVLANNNAQSAIIVGDMSYADGNTALWDSWFNLFQPLAAVMPTMVSVGNHEEEKCTEGSYIPYQKRFLMPFEASGAKEGNMYYSYSVGPAHIITLSSYSDYSVGSAQYQWLEADLKMVDRSVTPWLLVMFHVPWYSSNRAHQGEGEAMRLSMEPLLYAARADIIFVGHTHAYERILPVYNNQSDARGIHHMTVGDGGNLEGLADHWIDPQPDWSAYRASHYGYADLTMVNRTHAYWAWHINKDGPGMSEDSAWIVRDDSVSKPLVDLE